MAPESNDKQFYEAVRIKKQREIFLLKVDELSYLCDMNMKVLPIPRAV